MAVSLKVEDLLLLKPHRHGHSLVTEFKFLRCWRFGKAPKLLDGMQQALLYTTALRRHLTTWDEDSFVKHQHYINTKNLIQIESLGQTFQVSC